MRVIVTVESEQIFLERADWAVDLAGYAIVAGQLEDQDDPVRGRRDLVAPKDQSWRPDRRFYQPLVDHRGLFREFADIHTGPPFDTYEDQVIDFANRYGRLGLEEVTIVTDSGRMRGESQSDWGTEITAMRQCLELWDAFESGDSDLLGQVIQFNRSSVVYKPTDSEAAFTIASPNWHPYLWNFIRPGDPFDAAISFVQQVINDHLVERVSPRLLWNENRVLGLHQAASSLIGALWLQFARSVDARKSFHPCRSCGTWIEISAESARATRKYCSDACRSRHYRKRRSETLLLHARGHSSEEIANAVETTSQKVEKWIKSAKEIRQ